MFLRPVSWVAEIRDMPSHALTEYVHLLEKCSTGQISAIEFEREFLTLFKGHTTIRPEAEFLILDKLFASVDAFCSDLEIRDEDDLNEEDLRQECREAVKAIKELR